MAEENIPETAVITVFGLYEFTVMTFEFKKTWLLHTSNKFLQMVFKGCDLSTFDTILLLEESQQSKGSTEIQNAKVLSLTAHFWLMDNPLA